MRPTQRLRVAYDAEDLSDPASAATVADFSLLWPP
jgi:hypothetical protein